MKLFNFLQQQGHEQIVYCHDRVTGLRAIIAIHDTTLGPALGGCRMWKYANEQQALEDALRLARGMTYKASLAGLFLGGGKSVIFADPKRDKNPELLQSFGRFVDSLSGRYITAQDVSITTADIVEIRKATANVVGLPADAGGSGDPSPMTALGVYNGIKASVRHRLQRDSVKGVRVAIQGCGSVGSKLAELLHRDQAKLIVSDIDANSAQRIADNYGAQTVANDKIIATDVDVFSPCALGGIIDDDTVGQLKAKIIAGGANNQLAIEDKHGDMLREQKILYAPDYVINAGGLISVSYELDWLKKPTATVKDKVEAIYDTLLKIYQRADRSGESTHETSNRMAEERITNHTTAGTANAS